jgi:alpha-mannosidase
MARVPVADPSLSGFRVWIVPHTHWDREWYLPFEQFRMRLVRMVAEMVEVMERDPRIRHFTLDGQAVILEDVAELRPDLIPRLRVLAAAGRLSVGPAYVMPDEFLPGPESLVRNLLHGRAVVRAMGLEPMALGYSPDPFGHPAQLPQILAGFGLADLLFARGLGDEADSLGAIFWWEAPDGTRVLAHRQLGSYDNARRLSTAEGDPIQVFVERFGPTLERSATRDLLLCNGTDHEPIQQDIADVADTVAAGHAGITVQVAGYPQYVAAVREHLPADLATHRGEMVQGRVMSVLRGINSARMPLKQRYAAAEDALLTAETMAALAWLNSGTPYPHAELHHGWRELLRNSPHDSISGCSVDETHLAMAGRFLTAELIADRVRRESIAALAGKSAEWSYGEPIGDAYSVINPLPWARREVVELPGLGAVAVELPAFGASTVTKAAARLSNSAPLAVSADAIDNGIVRVEIEPAGTVALVDLASGRRWSGLHEFEDVADRGDEYNFCPVDGDQAIRTQPAPVHVRVIKSGPLIGEVEIQRALRLPRALTADRRRRTRASVSSRVSTRIRLTSGSPRVEFRTRLTNLARDHRLRVVFPLTDGGTTVLAESAFALVERSARPSSSGAGWREPPIPTQHTRGVVVAGSLGVAGRGLPEYEALTGSDGHANATALTLLRCVGWLSRDDLTTRRGHAGPALPVEDAQCLGEHEFEYALWVGERNAAEWLRESSNWRRRFASGEAGARDGSLLDVRGDGFVEGALKGAQDGDGVVLRVFASPDGASVTLPPNLGPGLCRLDESPLGEAGPFLRPSEIRSWRIRRHTPPS